MNVLLVQVVERGGWGGGDKDAWRDKRGVGAMGGRAGMCMLDDTAE